MMYKLGCHPLEYAHAFKRPDKILHGPKTIINGNSSNFRSKRHRLVQWPSETMDDRYQGKQAQGGTVILKLEICHRSARAIRFTSFWTRIILEYTFVPVPTFANLTLAWWGVFFPLISLETWYSLPFDLEFCISTLRLIASCHFLVNLRPVLSPVNSRFHALC